MSNPNYPSGQWVGFFTYSDSSQRHLMDLLLSFRNGVITGQGADGIGYFSITGSYNATAGECDWVKTYLGRHSVAYTGFREGKGIWGTWTLDDLKGGFHIWPLTDGPPLEKLKKEIEEEMPVMIGAPQ